MKVEDLLTGKGIEYTNAGGDLLITCLNPQHIDASPSLRVDRETGVMHCLACGFGKGIPSIFHYFNKELPRSHGRLAKIRGMIRDFNTLNQDLAIPENSIPFKDDYRGISGATYEKYFAFQQQSDWENRIVFPITDAMGKNKAFLGRTQLGDAKPKYLVRPSNVPLPLFPSRYGESVIVLVEGLFDMLNLEDKGMTNVVCCFGTHQFSPNNIKEKFTALEVSGVNTVVILFDNDDSGNKSADFLFKLIRDKTDMTPIVGNFLVPSSKDPGDLTAEEVESLSWKINKLLAEKFQ
ncbi:DNA replication primase [Providencia phage vB_PreS_PR1]|uniref:DNA replication primase n=1 Tax=Providencia phage vB_PreS_PR1 TaxID=1931407 RepID=A0A1S6KUY6_9CAUD|nr:DNA replication primase [Providencia phage vB_PreS_PR1]AQT25229.1 DNA replication primase [Providencia phage vB_PreS_PR1]